MNNNPLMSIDTVGNQIIPVFHNCITALPRYANKSLEELRWEDYQLKRKYPVVPPPPLRVLAQTSATASASAKAMPPVADLSRGRSTNGTQQIKYKMTPGADLKPSRDINKLIHIDTNHMSITAMIEYENESFEELRFKDYSSNCKYPLRAPASAASTSQSRIDVKPNEYDEKANVSNDLDKEEISCCPICLESILKVFLYASGLKCVWKPSFIGTVFSPRE